jgi:hypothetical protein
VYFSSNRQLLWLASDTYTQTTPVAGAGRLTMSHPQDEFTERFNAVVPLVGEAY